MTIGLRSRLLVVTTTLALTAASALAFGGPSQATPPGEPADNGMPLPTSLNEVVSNRKQELDAPKTQVPAFSVSAEQQVHGRVGGKAIINVTVNRRKGAGVGATNLKVRLSGPTGYVVEQAAEYLPLHGVDDAVPDWTCTPVNNGKDQDCTYARGDLSSGVSPDPIRATVDIAGTAESGRARIAAKATWTEDKVAPGHTGEANDPVVGTRNQQLVDHVDVTIDPKLNVVLEGATGDVIHIPQTGGTDAQRTGNLVAKIGNVNGRDAKATWSQTAGPSVTFGRALVVNQPAGSTGQSYVVPASTPHGTQLTFRVTVESSGHSVSDTKTVTVRTHSPGTFDPRTDTLADLAAATRQRTHLPTHGLKLKRDNYRAAIAGRGVQHVVATAPGARVLKTTTLRFTHPTGIKSVSWKSLSGRAGLLTNAVKTADSIAIRVPKTPGTWLIRGSADLKNGKKVSRTKVVKVDPIRVARQPAYFSSSTAAPSVCQIGPGDVLQFADGSTLTMPNGYSAPTTCTATSQQNFSGATFAYNGTTFGSANGVLSRTAATLTSVTFALPTQIATSLPNGSPTSFTITPPPSTTVSAARTNGAWGAWTGSFSAPWLSFVPVPTGWSAPAGSLTLAPTISGGKVTGANLNFTQESSASDGSGGSVSFDLSLNTAGPSDVSINAANLAVFQTASGNQIEFSGTGTFFLNRGQANSIGLSMNCSAPTGSGSCPLASGFALSSGTTLTWTQGQGLSLTGAQATVGSGSNSYTFSLSGTYASAGSWTLDVSNTGDPWSLGDTGVTLSDFTGTVSETTTGGVSEFAIDVGATVNNLNVGSELALNTVTASITNKCAQGAVGCTPGNVNVEVAVDATASLMNSQVTFNATASLNLTTMAFEFDTSDTVDVDFGPAGLHITSATLTLTDQTITGACQPTGGGSAPTGGALSLGVAANGTAYGQPITIGGDINSDGYCIWGALGDYSSGVFSGSDIVLAYSSYEGGATLTLPDNAGDPNAASPSQNTMNIDVPAGNIELTGGVNIPASATTALGLPEGNFTFVADADANLSSFTATATYTLDSPAFIGGGTTTQSVDVAISSVQIKIGLTTTPTTEATLSLTVEGDVVVASNNASCSANSSGASDDCSYAPTGGTIGIAAGSDGLSVNIQLGLNGTINDAFGQAGLTVTDLAISASANVPGAISLAVDAGAILPGSWTSGVALINNAPVSLAFDISDTSPCMIFSIGEEDSGTTYLDLDNAGVLTASYVNLVIAPTGCTIPIGSSGSKSVPAGYSFAFDGNILGDATTVQLAVSFDPTTSVNATLNLGAFNLLGVVAVQNTNIHLVMDGPNSLQVSFTGGFSLGDPSVAGGTVNVNGDIVKTSPGNFTLVLGGSGNVNLADVIDASITSGSSNCPSWTAHLPQPPNNCLVAIQQVNGQIVNADISANISFEILGTSLWGDLDLVYSDGTLQDFHLGLGASISFWVGSVSGTAYIDYCLGNLSPNGDGSTDGQSCAIGGSHATFRVYFTGSYEIGPCGSHWYDDACWTDGFSDTIYDNTFTVSSTQTRAQANAVARAAAKPRLNVNFGLQGPRGKTAFGHPANAKDYNLNLLWNHANVVGWTGNGNGHGGYNLTNTVMMSAVGPAAFQGVRACGTPANGLTWTPAAGTHNPAPTSPRPTAATCSLEVVYATPGSNVTPQFGGSGTKIPAANFDDFSHWSTTNARKKTLQAPGPNWFNAAQRGFAVCAPVAGGRNNCRLYSANKALVGTIISGNSAGTVPTAAHAHKAHTQLLNGLLSPMGTVPQGMRISSGSSVWSADGRLRLDVTDGVATLWDGGNSARFPDESGDGMSPRWTVGSAHDGGYLELAKNGVLHLRDTSGSSYWSSGSPSARVTGAPFIVIGGRNGLSVTDNTHLKAALWHA